jgi:putative endopeptidase
LNYGAIGAVIGHEITHGFDDQGRLFDAQGNMKEWWTPEDAENFNARAKRCIAQFDERTILEGKHHVNGDLTQGENIADIGGVKIALQALRQLQRDDPSALAERDEDGFTVDQRFFLSWAQFWASSARDEESIRLLAIDPHAPSQLRAFAPLQNVEEWYQAFGVQKGDAMYLSPEQRVVIW